MPYLNGGALSDVIGVHLAHWLGLALLGVGRCHARETKRHNFQKPKVMNAAVLRGQTKPKKGQFTDFSQGHSGTKVRCESCFVSKGKKHQNSQKWAKFMNFSFWPFLWFGLPGRLLRSGNVKF